MIEAVRLARSQSPALFAAVVGSASLIPVALAGWALDDRLVGGVNPWIKPLKFDVSVLVYCATLALVLRHLASGVARKVGIGVCVAMSAELAMIHLQAGRGVKSHFNQETALDGAIFTLMGLFIVFNTYLLGRVAFEYFRRPPALPPAKLAGIRWGLVSILVGSVLGGYMSSTTGHSVGVPDGGPGLPFVNWSTVGGDLRVAHFVGLHGFQALPLLGTWISRRRPAEGRFGQRLVFAAFVAHLLATLALFGWALQGKPLLLPTG